MCQLIKQRENGVEDIKHQIMNEFQDLSRVCFLMEVDNFSIGEKKTRFKSQTGMMSQPHGLYTHTHRKCSWHEKRYLGKEH